MIRIVLRSVGSVVAAGVAAGLALSVLSSRMLTHWAIAKVDYSVLPVMIVILLAVAGLAALIPARRAAARDPIQALKN